MRRLLPRRALVALALSLSLVGLAADPAHAFIQDSDSENRASVSLGVAELHYADPVGACGVFTCASHWLWSAKAYAGDGYDKWTCTETWADVDGLFSHRPPDLSINCRINGWKSGGKHQLHWVTGSGGTGGVITTSDITNGQTDVVVCKIDVRTWVRSTASNCQGSGVDVNSYTLYSWDQINAMNNVNEPEYKDFNAYSILPPGGTMYKGDTLAAMNGDYVATMQADGNFVVYDKNGAVRWAVSSCLAAGKSLVANSRLVAQTDGNLVIFSPTNAVVWASANINSCGGGSFGSVGTGLYMHNEGTLIYWSSAGGILWCAGC